MLAAAVLHVYRQTNPHHLQFTKHQHLNGCSVLLVPPLCRSAPTAASKPMRPLRFLLITLAVIAVLAVTAVLVRRRPWKLLIAMNVFTGPLLLVAMARVSLSTAVHACRPAGQGVSGVGAALMKQCRPPLLTFVCCFCCCFDQDHMRKQATVAAAE
jgi:hypothetical protein